MTTRSVKDNQQPESPRMPQRWPGFLLADPAVAEIYGSANNMVTQLAQQQFVTQGTMIALPLGFPGVSLPLARGECAVTALATGPGRAIYGVTSGRRSHLVCAMTHAATGFVHDMAAFDDLTEGVAVGVSTDGQVYACLNGPEKSCLIHHSPQKQPFDCLQEWVLHREPAEIVMTLPAGRKFVHAVFDPEGQWLIALLDNGQLVRIDLPSATSEELGQVDALGRYGPRLAVNAQRQVFGSGFGGSIWCFDPARGVIDHWTQPLACGPGREGYSYAAGWACDPRRNWLYTSSTADGTLSVLDCEARTVRSLGQVDAFSPVAAMTVTHDGRLFGVAGGADDIGRLFTYDPDRCELKDLGVCVSVLGARVYGFVFGAAVTGPDGEIIFGEADNVSHLWIYFPSIRPMPVTQ